MIEADVLVFESVISVVCGMPALFVNPVCSVFLSPLYIGRSQIHASWEEA